MAKRGSGLEATFGWILAGGIVYLLYRAFAPKTAVALPAPSGTGETEQYPEVPPRDLWTAPPPVPQPEMPPEEKKEIRETDEAKEPEIVNPFPPPRKHRRHPEMDGSFPEGSEDDILNDGDPDTL
jgi:hypothetical protein